MIQLWFGDAAVLTAIDDPEDPAQEHIDAILKRMAAGSESDVPVAADHAAPPKPTALGSVGGYGEVELPFGTLAFYASKNCFQATCRRHKAQKKGCVLTRSASAKSGNAAAGMVGGRLGSAGTATVEKIIGPRVFCCCRVRLA